MIIINTQILHVSHKSHRNRTYSVTIAGVRIADNRGNYYG